MEKPTGISGMAGSRTQAMSVGLCHAQIRLYCLPSQAGDKEGLSSSRLLLSYHPHHPGEYVFHLVLVKVWGRVPIDLAVVAFELITVASFDGPGLMTWPTPEPRGMVSFTQTTWSKVEMGESPKESWDSGRVWAADAHSIGQHYTAQVWFLFPPHATVTWAKYLTFPCLNVFICKIEIIIVCPS